MRRVLVGAALIAAGCGGGSSSPTTPTPPVARTFTLSGTVSESAPTTATKISGATVTFTDGSNAGKNATTDSSGNFSITGLQGGGFTVRVSANGYSDTSSPVTLTADATLNPQLDPSPRTVTSSRDDSVSGGDTCTGPSSNGDGCKQYNLDVHNAGTIDASLTWSDRDTWLWLELYKMPEGQQLASASSSRINGLTQHLSVNVSGHSQYWIRIRYALGARITPFSTTVSRPN